MANFRVRPLSHFGCYPALPLALGDDMLFEQHGLLFSCTLNRMVATYGQTKAEQPGFELENWTLCEVRFLAAMYLGSGPDLSITLNPLPLDQDVFAPTRDWVSSDPALTHRLARSLATDDHWMHANRGLIPEAFDRYRFEAWMPEQTARAAAVWQRFDLANPVLLRGMACLLKSGMLSQHFQFLDASLAAVHVAMDAAHSLVLAELRRTGVGNPSSLDAGRWIEEALGYQPTGLRFLEDWYDDHIRNFHPDSRFGAEAIPFFCIDDVYDLTHLLKEVFYFLIMREVYWEKREELERARR